MHLSRRRRYAKHGNSPGKLNFSVIVDVNWFSPEAAAASPEIDAPHSAQHPAHSYLFIYLRAARIYLRGSCEFAGLLCEIRSPASAPTDAERLHRSQQAHGEHDTSTHSLAIYASQTLSFSSPPAHLFAISLHKQRTHAAAVEVG